MFASRPGRTLSWPNRLVFLCVGVLGGYCIGYVFMDATQTIIVTGANKHHGDPDTPGSKTQATKPSRRLTYAGDTMHGVITSSGTPYQNMQTRITYGTYKLVQKMAGGDKMTGFTRILHRTKDDELMGEVPTFRANPMHPECDQWCDFPVADRPNAVQQWITAVDNDPGLLQGAWVLLLECDYVWMKPLQAPDANDLTTSGYQFQFDYIEPQHPGLADVMHELCHGCDTSKVPASGPAPVMLRFQELKLVTPAWERVAAAIEASESAKKSMGWVTYASEIFPAVWHLVAKGWVREMYAWDIAIMENKVSIHTEPPPASRLIAQPPHDITLGNACIYHYTWGAYYMNSTGQNIWKWEKRDFGSPMDAMRVSFLKMPPEFQEGAWHLDKGPGQDSKPVTRQLHDTLCDMLGQMNRVIDTLPDLSFKDAD